MWDMPDNDIHRTDRSLREGRQAVGVVCHAPAALVNVRGKDGEYLVSGKRDRVHEEAVGLTAVVPFAGRPAKGTGSIYSKTANWVPYVQVETGQNPASSEPAAS